MEFDADDPTRSSVHAVIDATQLWTGEPDRDAHLKSADFLDVEHYPQILFDSSSVRQDGANHYKVSGNVTIRGLARTAMLEVMSFGQWETPYWENGIDKGPITRAGFRATTSINRHDFGVSWSSALDRGGIVVGDEVFVDIDVEALKQK
jgi:polyisoprenoid-binding protein YceI